MVKWNGPFRSDRSNREKRSTSKGGPLFSKLFRLDLTDPFSFRPKLACVAGGMRERASGGRAAIFLSGEAREEFASGEAASEFPACHISYGFCLPPTFIAFDESIK